MQKYDVKAISVPTVHISNNTLLYVTVIVLFLITVVIHQSFISDTGFLSPAERCSLRILCS